MVFACPLILVNETLSGRVLLSTKNSRLMGHSDEPLPEPAKDLKNILRYPDRACEKAIAKIQTWINECETKHPNCRKPMISSLPSRVLDVFPKGSSQSISLVEGKGLKAEYMTLSYCWGKEAENSNGQ